jgi:hypothetical protein
MKTATIPLVKTYVSPYARQDSDVALPATVLKEAAKKFVDSVVCDVDGCKAPILFPRAEERPLCIKHKVDERHKKTTQMAGPQNYRPDREFNKSKIYPVRPADKEFITKDKKHRKPRDHREEQSNAKVEVAQTAPKIPVRPSSPKTNGPVSPRISKSQDDIFVPRVVKANPTFSKSSFHSESVQNTELST